MPRQFFTLKSILTSPQASSVATPGGSNVSHPPLATLETGHDGAGQPVLHELAVFDVEDMPPGVAAPAREIHHDEDQEPEEYVEEDELLGAPATADDEIEEAEYEPQHEEPADFAEPEPPPPPPPPPAPPPPPPVARFANVVTYDGAFEPVKNQMGQILGQSLNEVMRLRARAAEAFERKAEELLADLACAVLGRELRTDPADLRAIIEQMKGRMFDESPVVIRVSPEDAPYIQGPVVADPELGFGDLVFDTEDGQIDLRLGTRLAGLLRSQQVQVS